MQAIGEQGLRPADDLAEQRIAALERELAAGRAREKAWKTREKELTDFVENAVVGLHMVAPDGTILWANRADHEPLGYSAAEYIGHNICEFHADRETPEWILGQLREGKTLRDQPARLRCKDGTPRYVLISTNGHFRDGKFVNTRCVTIDVTAQHLLEAALQEAQNHLAAIIESSEDAVIAVDLSGRITSWNSGAERLYGYSRGEMIGRSIVAIIPPEMHFDERDILRRVQAGERVQHYETVRLAKDGRRIEVSLSVSPVRDPEGNLIGISKVARDITEHKEAQRQLTEAARRKDEFLAILAHELRNPLAPIRYALSIAKQANGTREQRQRANDVIERQVEHMARLLDDLLNVSRVARGRVELRKSWIDLTSVIGAAIDAARPLIDRKGHKLEIDLPREPLRLCADPVRLTQILSNLLTNAAKYTDRRGYIQLRAWRDGDSVAVSVRDDGIGISPDMKERLFHLFSQATPAVQRSEGGLGIGLALVKGFVELHGGSVDARSDGPGKGSEFVVHLPIGRHPGDEPLPQDSHQALPANRLRVLVADDNADAALTCAMLLELWGHEVRVAHTGREALAQGEEFQPEIALLDIGMPDMNGYEVATSMRGTPWGRNATLIAVTGWGQEEDKRHASEAGFDHHLTKPVDPAKLQPLLESLR